MNLLRRLLLLLAIVLLCLPDGFAQSSKQQNEQVQQEIEAQLFPGAKLAKDFVYSFPTPFEEVAVKANDGISLHGLLFKVNFSKGLIFYLHGSQGALDTWSKVAPTYTSLGYNVLLVDYRGYGKSEGKVSSQEQLFADLQSVYNYIKITYPENSITIIGQSIGTGPAAKLASDNHPKRLILQAPYYSISDWIQQVVPDIEPSLIRYQFNTFQYVEKTKAPVIIFHGDADEAIYYGSSVKLKASFKPQDQLITLKGEGHTDFTKNSYYLQKIKNILN